MSFAAIEDIISGYCGGTALDLGCGLGRSTRLLLKACKNTRVIGVDVDCNKLNHLASTIRTSLLSLVCSDASQLPIRSKSIDLALSMLTLHEVEERSIPSFLSEAYRVVADNGVLILIDKVLPRNPSPSEELVVLTEVAYHNAAYYVYSYRAWGVHSEEELVEVVRSFGFEPVLTKRVKIAEWISGEVFLREWGHKTRALLKEVFEEKARKELEELVDRIVRTAQKYGYGPVTMFVGVFRKA